MLEELFVIAFRNVRRRKIRSILTILGVAVGIAAIIGFVSIGEGMKNVVISSFGEVGTDLVVTPKYPSETLTYQDLKEIEKIEGIEAATPRLSKFGTLKYLGYAEDTLVIGVDPTLEKKIGIEVIEGRFLRGGDKYVAVLGYKSQNITIGRAISESKKTYQERKGEMQRTGKEEIRIDRRRGITIAFNGRYGIEEKRFRIIGVLKEGGMSGSVFSQPDNAVIVPIEILRDISDAKKDEISHIVIKLNNPSKLGEVSKQVRERTGANLMSLEQIIRSINSLFVVIEVMFFAIGSVALLVAGLSIMNTMLMSVLERTREIGILKSIGATKNHIIAIFLAESALIGLIGGIIGTLLGILTTKGIDIIARFVLEAYFKVPPESLDTLPSLTAIPPWMLLFSPAFAIFVSVIFGLYPALKASKMSPIDALRYI